MTLPKTPLKGWLPSSFSPQNVDQGGGSCRILLSSTSLPGNALLNLLLAPIRKMVKCGSKKLGGELGRRFREGSGEESKRRHIPPPCPTFWREDDEESHSSRGVFGSVIRPPTLEGVSFMLDLVVFTHFIEQFEVMNN